MDVRLPKPLHGWREFVGEVGIIVLGVLIALGAEQVVADFHQRAELREAEEAMTAELRDDDLPQAFTRASIYYCYSNQLDSVEKAVAAGDRAKFFALAREYRPVYRTWDDEAWKAALASQVLVQVGSKRMIGWSTPYVLIPLLSQNAHTEAAELDQLRPNLSGEGRLSPAQQDRLFQVISNLRGLNRAMSVSSLVLMYVTRERGLTLSAERKRALLSEARRKYGACVREPAPDQLNVNSQLSYMNGQLGSSD